MNDTTTSHTDAALLHQVGAAATWATKSIKFLYPLLGALSAAQFLLPKLEEHSLDEKWRGGRGLEEAEAVMGQVVLDALGIHTHLAPLVGKFAKLYQDFGMEELAIADRVANTAHELSLKVVEVVVEEFYRGDFSPTGERYVALHGEDAGADKVLNEHVRAQRLALLAKNLCRRLSPAPPTDTLAEMLTAKIEREAAHAKKLCDSQKAKSLLKRELPIYLPKDASFALVEGRKYEVKSVVERRWLRQLVDRFPERLHSKDLHRITPDLGEARKVFRAMRKRAPWLQLLEPAGKKGRGYGFRDNSAHKDVSDR